MFFAKMKITLRKLFDKEYQKEAVISKDNYPIINLGNNTPNQQQGDTFVYLDKIVPEKKIGFQQRIKDVLNKYILGIKNFIYLFLLKLKLYMTNRKYSRRRRRIKSTVGRASRNVLQTKRFLFLTRILFLLIIAGFVALFIILPIFAFNLPSPDNVIRRDGFSTKILDRNGKPLYDIYSDQNRIPVEFEEIPDDLKKATISIEDKNFYSHQGFDPFGMLRGLTKIFTAGRAQGGSTLTQQLVKNVLLSSERTIIRKIKEFVLSIQIERKYSKDEILRMYLNEAPYGGTAWGVGAASQMYFGKEVKDLSFIESVVLAGLPQRPTYYSPYSTNPDAFKERTKQVLRRMREDGYIDEEKEKQSLIDLDSIVFKEKGSGFKAPHFVAYVEKILEERYGEAVLQQGGLQVTTTLDLDLQEKAQDIVAEEIEKVESVNITNGAAIVIDSQTGEILSMVGSKDFFAEDYDGQVNVVLSLRQPGSAIKPFTYVTGFKKGYTASTLLMDTPVKFYGGEGQKDYEPNNYDGKFRGPVQVRYALANSINIPAVKMLALVGIEDVLETAYDMGISTLEPTKETLSKVGLSLTLGGGEVRLIDITGAYAAFMNQGFKIEPSAILKIEDNEGKILEENEPKKGKRVLTPEQAYMIVDILSDNDARKEIFGLNSLLNIPSRQIAVKTGTTNEKRDNWTIGGNMQAVVGVWVGNNDNSQMKEVASGVSGASPIWRRIILEYLKDKDNKTFEIPGGIVTAAVDSVSGYAAHDGFPSRIEKFIDGTQPSEDIVHVKMKVCKTDGKIATPADIASGNYEEKEFYVFKENDPASVDGENRWQDGINEWLSGITDPKYHPPGDYCGTQNTIGLDFVNPKNETSNLQNDFEIEIRAESLNKIVSVTIEVDGQKVITLVDRPYKYNINLTTGVHSIKAKAKDDKGNESEKTITIGVNVNWNYTPSPTPTDTPTPSFTLTPTPTI